MLSTQIDGIFAVGGQYNTKNVVEVENFNPETLKWEDTGVLLEKRMYILSSDLFIIMLNYLRLKLLCVKYFQPIKTYFVVYNRC